MPFQSLEMSTLAKNTQMNLILEMLPFHLLRLYFAIILR